MSRHDNAEEASPSGARVFKRSRSEPSTVEAAAVNGLPGDHDMLSLLSWLPRAIKWQR